MMKKMKRAKINFIMLCKVRKLITKIVSLSYSRMLHNVQIDNTLSPHLIVLGSIHRFIRGIENNSMHVESIKSLYRFRKTKQKQLNLKQQAN